MPNPTPARDAVAEAEVLAEFGIFASKQATSQWKAACAMAAEIVALRTGITAARADERARVKREAVDILNAMREEGESDLRQARARIEAIP